VLTRFGLPVFLEPDAPKPQPFVKLELKGGKLSVSLENRGNSHFVAQSVRLVGRAADGSVALQEDLPAWYVLASGRRSYELSPSQETCTKLAQVSANANTDHGVARTDYQVTPGACDKP
jgi:P pilus assembly chaperone PapD